MIGAQDHSSTHDAFTSDMQSGKLSSMHKLAVIKLSETKKAFGSSVYARQLYRHYVDTKKPFRSKENEIIEMYTAVFMRLHIVSVNSYGKPRFCTI